MTTNPETSLLPPGAALLDRQPPHFSTAVCTMVAADISGHVGLESALRGQEHQHGGILAVKPPVTRGISIGPIEVFHGTKELVIEPVGQAGQEPGGGGIIAGSIAGDRFLINGKPTYEGRTYRGNRIEGLLLNSRMVQGIFDDLHPDTAKKWAYPDIKRWDAERNTDEFIAAMPTWRAHGLLAFTINLQGGSPRKLGFFNLLAEITGATKN